MSDSFKKELLFDLGLLLLIAAVFLGGFAYFRLEFGRFAEKRSALSAKMDAHGPWAEQSVWAADDGSAYMLPSDDPYVPTAYLFIRGEWRAFAVVCGPSYSLWFEDPETGERAFESDFDLDETTVTLRRVKRSDYSYICPEKRAYVLTKAEDYKQALAALPFTPAAGT